MSGHWEIGAEYVNDKQGTFTVSRLDHKFVYSDDIMKNERDWAVAIIGNLKYEAMYPRVENYSATPDDWS